MILFLFQDGATPLFLAAQEGHVTVIRQLLVSGAKVNQAREVRSWPLVHIEALEEMHLFLSHILWLPIPRLHTPCDSMSLCPLSRQPPPHPPGWHCSPVDGSSDGSQWGGEGAALTWCRSGCWQTSTLLIYNHYMANIKCTLRVDVQYQYQ